MKYDPARALQLLRLGSSKPGAQFRPGQEDAIRHVVLGQGRLLVVQKTGWGKSFVYFIACKLLREAGKGPALLISPLLSLMRNQIAAAERMGLRAMQITSENRDAWADVEAALGAGEVDVLLVSPERLTNDRFRENVMSNVSEGFSLLVIDEAHCISDWGHDFRPHYRLVERIARDLPGNVRMLATTATANNRVMLDLEEVLGPGLTVSRGDLNRPALSLQTISMPEAPRRLAWLAGTLSLINGSGIIYTLTVRDAQQVAAWLKSRGFAVEPYTGEMGPERAALEDALLTNRLKALVATTALGMGFDKPDLAFVIHYQSPGSVVAYYQQVGRAGRAMLGARGVLLSGAEDTEVTDWFIETAFPTRDEAEAVIRVLQGSPTGLKAREIEAHANIRYARIVKALELLSLEDPAPVVREGARWRLTTASLLESFWERTARLTELRRFEQRQMQEYVSLTEGHMEFLLRALDGDTSTVKPPELPPLSSEVDAALVRDATAFMRGGEIVIKPREFWPAGGMPVMNLKGRIEPARRAQPGRALCYWGDGGWGELVQSGKYRDGRFSDELVEACARLLGDWKPDVKWVSCVPSRRQTQARDFAERLAATLGLPFRDALEKTQDRPEQKKMANSAQQARNLDGALRVLQGVNTAGGVLLVDDMVDSGWTFTVAAWLLREAGSGEVFPLALANTGYRT